MKKRILSILLPALILAGNFCTLYGFCRTCYKSRGSSHNYSDSRQRKRRTFRNSLKILLPMFLSGQSVMQHMLTKTELRQESEITNLTQTELLRRKNTTQCLKMLKNLQVQIPKIQLKLQNRECFTSGGTVTTPVEGTYDETTNWLDSTRKGNTAHVDHANAT